MFPSTRYQGSKLKLTDWLRDRFSGIPCDGVLDVFGGTGTVSLLFKHEGKRVHYNDYLRWNATVGTALVANGSVRLDPAAARALAAAGDANREDGFISRTFDGIYFTSDENRWLDGIVPAIRALDNEFERAIALYSLYQACLVKRPYNLFHRRNLSLRTADVPRSFGNKATWEKPFTDHFLRFAAEANRCVFDNGRANRATCLDAMDLPADENDLVYLDPPYVSAKGSAVDYHQFYHFLEGLTGFDDWPGAVDFSSKHRRLIPRPNPWSDRRTIRAAFDDLVDKHRRSTIAISYRSDGIPSIDDLAALLRRHGKTVRIERREDYRYVLSKAATDEVLVIGA